MATNPLGYLKYRLSSAIHWRVTQEFDKERDLIRETNKAIVEVSARLSDEISTLSQVISNLEARVSELEERNTEFS